MSLLMKQFKFYLLSSKIQKGNLVSGLNKIQKQKIEIRKILFQEVQLQQSKSDITLKLFKQIICQ